LCTITSRADFIVSIGSATVQAGDTAIVDVTVTGAATNAELLDFFVAPFRLTVLGGSPTVGAFFIDPQSISFDGNPDYIFLGNSFGVTQEVTDGMYADDTLTVGDGTADFSGVDVNNQVFLLAQLEVGTLASTPNDSVYTISILDDEQFFANPALDGQPITVNTGSITVLSSDVQAVPVPAGMVLVGIGFPLLAIIARKRGRSSSSTLT
jgi:hypothetical protein